MHAAWEGASKQAANLALALLFALLMFAGPAPLIADKAPQLIQDITIEGLERTRPRTVLRQLPFRPGDRWQPSMAETGERWLRNLGLFSEVHIRPPDHRGIVHIIVRERWSLWLLPQFSRKDNGDSSAGMALDEYNFWGLNHHLHLAYIRDTGKNFSNLNGTSYQAGYDWLRIRDSMWNLHLSGSRGNALFDSYQQGALVAQYLQSGNNIALSVDYGLGPVPDEGWSLSFGLSLNHTNFHLLAGPPQADVQGTRKHAILAGASYRQLDDRITWIRGTAFDYQASYAPKWLGSTIHVLRQTLSWRNYQPIHGHDTINYRLEAGLATGEVLRDGLFDLGNRNGIRGYYPGEVQSKSYLIGSLEGRFLPWQDGNIQLVPFADVGILPGRSYAYAGKNTFIGVGAGIRWTLRWLIHGTLRGDAAYGFATHRWRFYLGTGQAF